MRCSLMLCLHYLEQRQQDRAGNHWCDYNRKFDDWKCDIRQVKCYVHVKRSGFTACSSRLDRNHKGPFINILQILEWNGM